MTNQITRKYISCQKNTIRLKKVKIMIKMMMIMMMMMTMMMTMMMMIIMTKKTIKANNVLKIKKMAFRIKTNKRVNKIQNKIKIFKKIHSNTKMIASNNRKSNQQVNLRKIIKI